MIHHGLTAELNALRIAGLNAEAERRRLRAAVPKNGSRRRRLAILAGTFTQRRSSTVRSSARIDSTAEQCA
jgi:hypothetical protein